MKCAYCFDEIRTTGHTCGRFTQFFGQPPSRAYDRNIRLNLPEKELLNEIIQTLSRLENKIDKLEKK